MRYALRISYDGTAFAGWQMQPRCRTVQGEILHAAEKVLGYAVFVTASGRTDAGVHALSQVCHFDAETKIPPQKLMQCFNGVLPDDVRVLESAAADGFDCLRGVKRKTYMYNGYYAAADLPLYSRYAARIAEKPDVSKMREAALLLEGEHDFKAFCATGSSAKTTKRTVYSVTVGERMERDAIFYPVTVCGNGFLYNMVRIIAGTLYAIGCGKRQPEGILNAFSTGKRNLLGKTMPPQGLTLIGAEYENSPFASDKGVGEQL